MTALKIYFDGRCGLCVWLVRWLERQQQIIPLRCVPKHEGIDDVVVVADSGEYWRGDSAWLIVLWALGDYRQWSYRLALPYFFHWPAACSPCYHKTVIRPPHGSGSKPTKSLPAACVK